MKRVISFLLIGIFLAVAPAADAMRITVNIPKQGAPTHNGGAWVKSVVRKSADSCSVQLVFDKKPKFLMASLVGRPYSTGSGEAPALIVSIAQPSSDGKSFIFGCFTTDQITYKDMSNHDQSAIVLETSVNSGATLNVDADF